MRGPGSESLCFCRPVLMLSVEPTDSGIRWLVPVVTNQYMYSPGGACTHRSVPVLTAQYLYLPASTCTHQPVPVLTAQYPYSPPSTCTHQPVPVLTSQYLYPPPSTCTHQPVPVLTGRRLRRPVPDVERAERALREEHLVVVVERAAPVELLHDDAAPAAPVEESAQPHDAAHADEVRVVGVRPDVERVLARQVHRHHRVAALVREQHTVAERVDGERRHEVRPHDEVGSRREVGEVDPIQAVTHADLRPEEVAGSGNGRVQRLRCPSIRVASAVRFVVHISNKIKYH